ncbi:ankyrin repeat-containing domain protein [Coniochaeta sp. 2T2.1]|nr:ankyrin repeat-containing domain protein [Coniochaeta sp. 2T2.1]
MAASPGRSQLERLPNELLHNIGSECGIKHLTSLIRCNKDLYDRLYPTLIKSEVKFNHGRAALWAVNHGRLGLLRSLHQHGLSITLHWGRERKAGWIADHDILGNCNRKDFIPDPMGKMPISFSLLHIACSMGLDHIISWLLDYDAVINAASSGVNSCAGTGHRYKFPIREPIAWTPLEMAVCRRRTSSVELLLERATAEHGRTAVDGLGCQALHTAVHHGHHEVVDVLLQSGRYDVNAPNAHNELPVNLRGPRYRVHLPTLRVLLQAKPDLTIESFCEKSIFFRTRRVPALPLHDALAAGEYEAALLLLEAGADATALCGGLYPLHCAFLSGKADEKKDELSRLRLLMALLARGADPNARSSLDNFTGVTPLMLAAWYAPYPEIIKLFLKHGADVNSVDE